MLFLLSIRLFICIPNLPDWFKVIRLQRLVIKPTFFDSQSGKPLYLFEKALKNLIKRSHWIRYSVQSSSYVHIACIYYMLCTDKLIVYYIVVVNEKVCSLVFFVEASARVFYLPTHNTQSLKCNRLVCVWIKTHDTHFKSRIAIIIALSCHLCGRNEIFRTRCSYFL